MSQLRHDAHLLLQFLRVANETARIDGHVFHSNKFNGDVDVIPLRLVHAPERPLADLMLELDVFVRNARRLGQF